MPPVVIAGMIAGGALILTAIAVFLMKKEFPAGGIGVAVVGLVCIAFSQWSSLEIEVGGLRLKALRDAIEQTAAAAEVVAEQAERAAASAENTKLQLAELTRHIESRAVLPPALVRPIRERVVAAPTFDPDRLRRARTELERVRVLPR
jgi:hypothetical protein